MGRTTGVGKRWQQPCGRVPSRPPRSGLQRARYVLKPATDRPTIRTTTAHARPPPTQAVVSPNTEAVRPGPQVAQPGTARDHDHEHALHPPAHLVGRVGLQDRLPPHRGDQVGRAADGQEQHAPATTGWASPRRGDGQPPHGDHDVSAMPCRWTRPTQPDNSPPTTAPTAMRATSQPSASATRRSAGRRAPGTARWAARTTIAMMSTTNDIISTGAGHDEAQALDDRPQPGPWISPPSGGSGGSRTAA